MSPLRDLIKKVFTRKRQYALNSVISLFLIILLLIIINFITQLHEKRVDLTASKNFTFSQQTINILKKFDSNVKIIGFFKTEDSTRNRFLNLVDTFKYYSKHIAVQTVDPDKSPTITKQYGIKEYNTVLIEYKGKTQKTTNITEAGIATVLKKTGSDKQKTICFIEGHNENYITDKGKTGYSKARISLEKDAYEVKPILLVTAKRVPKDCHTLVIPGPEKKFNKKEIDQIREFIENGGPTIFLLEPEKSINLVVLAKEYDILVRNDVVVDKISKLYGGDYTVPIVTRYMHNHAITKTFRLPTFFPIARSVTRLQHVSADTKSEFKATPFLRTSKDSWGETEIRDGKFNLDFNSQVDYPGPLTIATISERKGKKPIKLAVVGDSSFANNTHFDLSGNGDMFLNIINYLAGESDLIAVRAKEAKVTPLVLSKIQGVTFWCFYLGALLLTLTSGSIVFFYRRKL
jgi:ABC-type uncharacterized transport system involved in gliding motility auxiliary subunit